MSTIIFLGAGASAAEGAPETKELLKEAFKVSPSNQKIRNIVEFIEDFYFWDRKDDKMPTFEEILTDIDIALSKQEELSAKLGESKLRELRMDLIYSICETLNKKLIETPKKLHKKFVDKLFTALSDKFLDTTFISLNYDIILDNVLYDLD